MRTLLSFWFALLCLIPLFSGAQAQQYSTFPDLVNSSYFAEDYSSALVNAQEFMISISDKPAKEIRDKNIRFAYFAVWEGCNACIATSRVVVDLWKKSYPNWNDSLQIPANENADYNAIKAVLANREGKTSQAIEFIENALGLRELNTQLDSAIQADAYQFLGRLLKRRFYHAKAVANYRVAMRLNSEMGRDNAIFGIILEKASAELEANKDDPQILGEIKNALNHYLEMNSYRNIGYAENELGNYWLVHEDYSEAIMHFRNYMKIMLDNQADGVDIAYNNISAAYTHLDEPDSILYYMRASLKATSQEKLFQVALLNSNMGATYGVMNKPDSALFYFKKALKMLYPEEPVEDIYYNPNPGDFPLILPRILTNKGNALFELSKRQDKEEYLQAALEAIKTAINQFNQIREMSSYENKHIFARESRSYYFLALKIATACYEQNPTIENYNLIIKYAQQSKSAVFNEFQRILLVRDKLEIDKSLIARDDSLKLLKSETNQQLFNAKRAKKTPEEISELYAQIVILDQEIEQIKNTIQADYPVYSKYIFNPDPISLNTVQNTLHQNETLVDFTISDSLMIVLAINKQQQHVYTLRVPNDFIICKN